MRGGCIVMMIVGSLAGCGPPAALREMHRAYNTGQSAAVTEKFADFGRPQNLDGVSDARVAAAAHAVFLKSGSAAYRDLALRCYDLAAAMDPALADEHCCAKGDLLMAGRDAAGALEAYLEAVRINPRHVKAAAMVTRLLLEVNRPAEAVNAGGGLMAADRPLAEDLRVGLLNLARAMAIQKQDQAAMNVFRHAWAIGPSDWRPDILHALAAYYDSRGENGRARHMLQKALVLLPDASPRRAAFTQYLERLEAGSQNAAELSQAAAPQPAAAIPAAAPGSPGEAQPRGTAARREPSAEDPVAKATRLASQAALLANENKDAEAIRLLEAAVALAPKLPACAAQLAALHVKLGDLPAAVKVLETAMQSMPENEILRQMLDQLRAAQGADSRPG